MVQHIVSNVLTKPTHNASVAIFKVKKVIRVLTREKVKTSDKPTSRSRKSHQYNTNKSSTILHYFTWAQLFKAHLVPMLG